MKSFSLCIRAAALAGLSLAAGCVFENNARPPLEGLGQAVDIYQDKHDVPHIFAETVNDAYFAQGFLHAKNRLWQMELARRAGSGRLAEIFGADVLDDDRFFRVLGLKRAAEANLQRLDPTTVASLNAYAQGVNAYLAQKDWLPVEFYLSGAPRPEPWRPVDSLVILKAIAWSLSGNWWEELLNLRLQQILSPAEFADLFPPYPGDAPKALPDVSHLYPQLARLTDPLLARHRGEADKSVGSNNWVVDGGRSASGGPLLANDPHLPLTAPSIWYFAHLHAQDLNAIGASLPGVPGILLGRNDKVAWAFTNTGPDSQDVFVEKLAPGDATRYLTPEGPAPFAQFQETIRIKDAPDESLAVRVSRHGPVISDDCMDAGGRATQGAVADVDADAKQVAPQGMALALSWVGLRADDMTVRFMLNAGRAQTAAELKQAARDFHTPQQNIVYADAAGDIGFVAAGRVPVRAVGNPLQGLLPAPGWLAEYDWQGLIPFEQLPQQSGSGDGKIVTANQKITPPDYPHWITSGWALPYRAERIAALLDARAKHDVSSFSAIQSDVANPVAEQLLGALLSVKADDGGQAALLQSMRGWDRRMSADAAQPLIFAEWIRQLAAVLYKERLGDLYEMVGDYNPLFLANLLSNQNHVAERWCAPAQSPAALCDAETKQAFQAALHNLRRHFGDDPSRWRWGGAHITVFKHQPYGQAPIVGKLFNVEVASAGGMDTINVSGYRYDDASGRYLGEAGVAFRAIYDLAEPDRSIFILGTGQSGNPFSPHYRDMTPAWLRGGQIPMLTDRGRILQDAAERITLSPQ